MGERKSTSIEGDEYLVRATGGRYSILDCSKLNQSALSVNVNNKLVILKFKQCTDS